MTELPSGITVERLANDNDDLTVVNAARVSHGKESSSLTERDTKLIQYLADNEHWTPFGHVRFGFAVGIPVDFDWSAFLNWAGHERRSAGFRWWLVRDNAGRFNSLNIYGSLYGWLRGTPTLGQSLVGILGYIRDKCPASFRALSPGLDESYDGTVQPLVYCLDRDHVTFRIKAPIFVLRQLMRSNIGIVYNEVSRRYVDSDPEYHTPISWRSRPESGIKQGSGGDLDELTQVRLDERYDEHLGSSERLYPYMLALGVAPEQARMHLPLSTMSEVWATMTDAAVERVIRLRSSSDGKNHSQLEIRELAEAMKQEMGLHDTSDEAAD